jgi:nitrile hydratase
MGRIHDVGGMQGFGAVDPAEHPEPFVADWEARVFALNSALVRAGLYTLDEFRDAIERLPPARYLATSYYERWFAAICELLVTKGVASADELEPPS